MDEYGEETFDSSYINSGYLLVDETGIHGEFSIGGVKHVISYEGKVEYIDVTDQLGDDEPGDGGDEPVGDYYSTLTSDYACNFDNHTLYYEYYGDYYECGYDYWSIALMESVGPINGDYFMIDIITDALNEGASEDNVIGTYAACSDLDIKPNSFLVGVMEGAAYINSWRLVVEDDYIINGNGRVPMTTGSVKIEREGNGFLVTIDSMDDANHKVQGTFSCGGVELYDRSKR
jgi:hypothetical protein